MKPLVQNHDHSDADDADDANDAESWHLISAYKPSFKSSIGAHTINVSLGLKQAKQEVHVWYGHADNSDSDSEIAGGIKVHGLSGPWDAQGFERLALGLAAIPGRKRILLQYTPDAFGKNISLHLQTWMESRSKVGDWIGLVVHKRHSKSSSRFLPLRYWQKMLNRTILKKTIKLSQEVFVSSPKWIPSLQKLTKPDVKQIIWLPVPSNVLRVENKQRALNLRKAFAPDAKLVIGTFGSFYDPGITKKIRKLVPDLLSNHPERVWLFLGRGSDEFVLQLRKDFPMLENQLEKAGELDMAALSAHLQACDLMVQTYPRGVDTSRASIMVGLSHGKPIVTSLGPNTEAIWAKNSCVKLVPEQKNELFVKIIEELISNQSASETLGKSAIQTYKSCFSLEQCIKTLLSMRSC